MQTSAARSTTRSAIAFVAIVAILTTALVYAADRASAARNSDVLGVTKRTPKPLCPDPCRATGSVTGFGVIADGKRGLYKAPADGHIVAWSIELSKPNSDQISGFNEIFKDNKFGKAPQAGLSILKRKGKNSRYRLAKSSPVIPVGAYLGEKPIFTLRKPLRVQKGRIAALTLPTWAPLYKDGLDTDKNSWKASRKKGECGVDTVPDARPHLRKGSTRSYGCNLTGERILYWAYFVPSQKKGK